MIRHVGYFLMTFFLFFVFAEIVNAQQSPVEVNYEEYENYHSASIQTHASTKNAHVIIISTQENLSKLSSNIKKAIKEGKKNIEVRIASGVFYYDNRPVFLYNIDAKNVSISIKGSNTIMVAGGRYYPDGESIVSPNRNHVYLDQDLNLIDLYGEVQQADGRVEVLDTIKKTCRIAISQPYNFVSGMRVQISEWFYSPVYEVSKIQDGFLYFIAHNLKYDEAKKCYNVHYDNRIGNMNPRIRLIDPQNVTTYKNAIHECEVSQFMMLYHVKLRCFAISGITFCGCAKGKEALCYFRNVDAEEIDISDCNFKSLNHRIVKLKNTGNFVFQNNTVSDCYYGALYADIDCPKTIVKNNNFYRAEKGWTNASCVACYGQDFLIANNQFEDIGYASIVSGYHHKWSDKIVSRGVIEYNEISFGDDYYSHPEKYTLIDGGAIYIGTLNDLLIVRYNYIHNYRGVRSNRAIYCDDGAMNVKIYGNVIYGVTNAHSILSWRAKSVNKKFPQSNDGIDFYYNVIWGNYKFDERPNSSCIHGKNLILYGEGDSIPENSLNNFAYQEQDVFSSGTCLENGKIIMPEETFNELKLFPTYDKMKKWIE